MRVNTFLMLAFILCGFGSCMLGMQQKEEGGSGSDGSSSGKDGDKKKKCLTHDQEFADVPHAVSSIPSPPPVGTYQQKSFMSDQMNQDFASPTMTHKSRGKVSKTGVVLEIPVSPAAASCKLFRGLEYKFPSLYRALMQHSQKPMKRTNGHHSVVDPAILSSQSIDEKVLIMHDILRLKGGSHRDGCGDIQQEKTILKKDATEDPGRFDLNLVHALDHIHKIHLRKDFLKSVKSALVTATAATGPHAHDVHWDDDEDKSDCSQDSSVLSEAISESDDHDAITSVLNRVHLRKDESTKKYQSRSKWRGIKMWVSSMVGSAMTIAAGTLYILKQIEACCPCPEASPLNSTRTFF